jgi:hypothetical protein
MVSMPSDRACYRSLAAYKYQLTEDYAVQTKLTHPVTRESPPHLRLSPEGILCIGKFYAWDGPSGPTIDTKNFMRGALVHDAIYQMMREGVLGQEHRAYADDLMKEICLEDGMSSFRAWYVHKAVRWFAARHAAPTVRQATQVTCVP